MKKNQYGASNTDLHILLSIVATLTTIGLLFVYSASSVYALETFGSSHYYLKKQLFGVILGVIACMAVQFIKPTLLKSLSPLFLIFSTILTGLTFFAPFAVRIHGSSRWLNIGGFVFQPSELLKMAFVLSVARFLEQKQGVPFSMRTHYIPLACMLGIPLILLLKQPDFGVTVTLAITVVGLLWVAQLPLKHLAITIGSALPLVLFLILIQPYRLRRVLTFLNPWNDPQGAGFQIIQSLIAIGSGGFWGKGIAHSEQKFFYLPMQHTDFIFSIIAEETGFIGSIFLISLYLLLVYVGIRLALSVNNLFSRYCIMGYILLINLQAAINITVATGLAPTKGIGLPFVSYGNTSLICTILMIGIMVNLLNNEVGSRSSSNVTI